jgi:hypothetical protein
MNNEVRDFTTRTTSETARAKEDIFALDRWEGEGGRVRPPLEGPVNANPRAIMRSRQGHDSRVPLLGLTSCAKEPS